jgi:hypothetical protein
LCGVLAGSVVVLALVASASAAASSGMIVAGAASAPAGYHIESSAMLVAPGSMYDSGGREACPTGTVVWGGGVGFNVYYNDNTLNTSAVSGSTAWQARVNNPDVSSPLPSYFGVDAICANKPKLYKYVSNLVDDPAGMQTSGSATCPKGTVLLSGSVLSHGDTTSEYQTSAWPSSSRKFTAYQENSSSSDQPFDVTALCAQKPAGYKIVTATDSAPADSIWEAAASCPSGTSVIGGGVHVATPQPQVTPNWSKDASSKTWDAVVYNANATTAQITGYAICAA